MNSFRQQEFDAFLRSILDAPDDALPRLIAADWCMEYWCDRVADLLRNKRLPIDPLTVEACEVLLCCRVPGQFVQDVCESVKVFSEEEAVKASGDGPFTIMVQRDKDRLSPKQYLWVWKLIVKYERRVRVHNPKLVERAREILSAKEVASV